MWNPFKKKFRVPVSDCIDAIKSAIVKDGSQGQAMHVGLWEWLEHKHRVKRKYDYGTGTNYLVFNNKQEYTWFLLKL